MPLSFDSLSHGTIAFGFFNIESDMLLCDRYFLFADEFCTYVGDMAGNSGEQFYQASWALYVIETAEDVGDLMGAIHGVHFTGFIGELYRRFPFPQEPEEFKQNPAGAQTQALVTEIISRYGKTQEIAVAVDPNTMEIELGAYCFNHIQFQELLKYVWRGGYPRWKNEIRPAYVLEMKNSVLLNDTGVFSDIEFGD
ncbi:MAG: hypothetical protein WBM69_09800 [Desulfobacterales bacterium]